MRVTRLSDIGVVLVEVHDPQNLGAIARAMKNFGLSRLALVRPRVADFERAQRLAVHATDLLDSAAIYERVADAVRDDAWVVGTTMRPIPGTPPLTPRDVADQARALPEGSRASLVFGGETSGLDNETVLRCHAVATIPADPSQPSLNLAQALLLFAYELRLALSSPDRPSTHREPLATDSLLAALESHLEAIGNAAGFADPHRPRHGTIDLAHTLRRAQLSGREAGVWQAFLSRVRRRLSGDA